MNNLNNKTSLIRSNNLPNITIIGSSTNVNNIIKIVPVNEFTKTYEKEFNIVLKKENDQQHDILQFMEDTTSNYLFSEKSIFLQQIINKKLKNNDETEFGIGSTFKKEFRKNYRLNDKEEISNYKLTIDKGRAQKVFKTIPQQVNSNSRYFVFVRKNQSTFEAYPVANWYKMNPYTKLDINAIEESEKEFIKGQQVMEDQLLKMTREEQSDGYAERENKVRIAGKIDIDLSEDETNEKDVVTKKKKAQLFQKLRYGKKEFVDEDSDKDDHEGDEVDYMSDSSYDEDKLSEEEVEKIYQCINVDEEEMLTKELELSDESGNEEEIKKEEKINEPEEIIDSSDSESDDDDDDDNKDDSDSDDSIVIDNGKNSIKKIKSDFNNNPQSFKRPHLDNSNMVPIKKAKFNDPKQREIVEEIRRHLTRKPMFAKEVFRMLIKKQLLGKDEISKKKLMDAFSSLSAKHDMVNGERMFRL